MIELIAAIAHEANRAYCITIGDRSCLNWNEAPEWQKVSAMEGVRALIANPRTTPEQSHESWLKKKLAEGWKWGTEKNADLKHHPCIVPYADLPPSQQAKDVIFTEIVLSMHRQLVSDSPVVPPGSSQGVTPAPVGVGSSVPK